MLQHAAVANDARMPPLPAPQQLIDGCSAALAGYPTTIDEDLALLNGCAVAFDLVLLFVVLVMPNKQQWFGLEQAGWRRSRPQSAFTQVARCATPCSAQRQPGARQPAHGGGARAAW